jgi:arginase
MDNVVRIFGVPMDLGQNRRGVDMGPSAIRYAGLQERLRRLGYTPHDGGNIIVPQVEEVDELPDTFHEDKDIGKAHYLPQVAAVCQEVYDHTRHSIKANEKVIFLGGDHSISIGTVAAVTKDDPIGLIWVDAHGDMNTPHTSPSGNIHGMSLASLLGYGPDALVNIGYNGPKIQPSQVIIVGLRELDGEERKTVVKSGITTYTMPQIDEYGMGTIAHMVMDKFANFKHIHVSLDMDSLDASIAPGVGTPVPGGLTYREAHLLMEILADSGKVRSVDVVEVNPILDERNRTAEAAVDLIASLMGQRII